MDSDERKAVKQGFCRNEYKYCDKKIEESMFGKKQNSLL